eukprot:jgi/Botrbrau1/23393/Bobra.0051s0039.2
MHLKNFNKQQLRQLCEELRQDIISSVSTTGGHLGSSLGVVELTVALHYVFNAPYDRIIWDVGHQAYGHKILTGRRDRMNTIRQSGGLSGFTNRSESDYDAFGAGHSSTSISAAVGMAIGLDIKGMRNHSIAVIGDGAITGGMAYEAMNHAGFENVKNLIIILNDNQQVSLPTHYNGQQQSPVGALSATLAKLQTNKGLLELRERVKAFTKTLPAPLQDATAKMDEYARGMISGVASTLFEELGCFYVGPIDGHDVSQLVDILRDLKETPVQGPVLLHVRTQKGQGYKFAEEASDRMHGVGKYDPETGEQFKGAEKTPSYTHFFADALIAEAELDSRVQGIHAAMGGGTGMNRFAKRFQSRTYDVGIAEQHAVTFAAGLACEGLVPVVAIYSSFLQRGYDQVIHDVALQSLPVRFAMDRAGLVGADGATHSGFADVTFMGCLPNMVVMAPSNEAELCNALATAIAYDEGPSCFRFPRGNGIGVDLAEFGVAPNYKGRPWVLGKASIRRSGKDVAFLAYGTVVNDCLAAAEMLAANGVSATVVDMRFCKPLDKEIVKRCAKEHPVVITVEENAIGGFGSHVLHCLALEGLLDTNVKVRPMVLPDRFIEHATQQEQLATAGLDAAHIFATAIKTLGLPYNAPAVLAGAL